MVEVEIPQGNGGEGVYWKENPSAKVHISPLYLMGHVRDGGPNYKTQVVAFLVHVRVTPDKIRGSGTFFFRR